MFRRENIFAVRFSTRAHLFSNYFSFWQISSLNVFTHDDRTSEFFFIHFTSSTVRIYIKPHQGKLLILIEELCHCQCCTCCTVAIDKLWTDIFLSFFVIFNVTLKYFFVTWALEIFKYSRGNTFDFWPLYFMKFNRKINFAVHFCGFIFQFVVYKMFTIAPK